MQKLLYYRPSISKDDPAPDAECTLGGFAQTYYDREVHDVSQLQDVWEDQTDFEKLRSPAMHVYLPEQVQVFTDIAENFACSDTYFASCPCQTWPNRHFAATGHCYGYVNNLAPPSRGTVWLHDHCLSRGTTVTGEYDHELFFSVSK